MDWHILGWMASTPVRFDVLLHRRMKFADVGDIRRFMLPVSHPAIDIDVLAFALFFARHVDTDGYRYVVTKSN